MASPEADCLLFDTTNYYSFMASHTDSDLAKRGKNKDGRHHLRQIGLGMLVARDSRLPLYYSVYPGNDQFEVLDTARNRYLIREGRSSECTLAYRSRGEYWGKERAVVMTYNPRTAHEKQYTLQSKLDSLREELLQMRIKVKESAPHWRNPEVIRERYVKRCAALHISSTLFDISFKSDKNGIKMSFRKNAYNVKLKQDLFGKSIIITDNTDWPTADIVEASSDRWQTEDRFRQSKHEDLVGVGPIRHWTDSKIRCHLFTCVVSMVYLRLIGMKVAAMGITRSAQDIMNDMHHLHSVLLLPNAGSPYRLSKLRVRPKPKSYPHSIISLIKMGSYRQFPAKPLSRTGWRDVF